MGLCPDKEAPSLCTVDPPSRPPVHHLELLLLGHRHRHVSHEERVSFLLDLIPVIFHAEPAHVVLLLCGRVKEKRARADLSHLWVDTAPWAPDVDITAYASPQSSALLLQHRTLSSQRQAWTVTALFWKARPVSCSLPPTARTRRAENVP